MSNTPDYITIDQTDYFPVEVDGHTYFVGEEVVLDHNQKEIGFVSSRGSQSFLAAFDDERNEIGSIAMNGYAGTILDTEETVVRMMVKIRAEAGIGVETNYRPTLNRSQMLILTRALVILAEHDSDPADMVAAGTGQGPDPEILALTAHITGMLETA